MSFKINHDTFYLKKKLVTQAKHPQSVPKDLQVMQYSTYKFFHIHEAIYFSIGI